MGSVRQYSIQRRSNCENTGQDERGLLSQDCPFYHAIYLKPCSILNSHQTCHRCMFPSRYRAHYAAQVVCSSEGATAACLLFGRGYTLPVAHHSRVPRLTHIRRPTRGRTDHQRTNPASRYSFPAGLRLSSSGRRIVCGRSPTLSDTTELRALS
jgi:hypothetical protein